jgi:opacity protein-like surface antigen
MKTKLLTGIAALFVAGSMAFAGPMAPQPTGPAPTPTGDQPGTFIGLDAGAFWVSGVNASNGLNSASLHFKTGWGLDVPVGYNLGNGWSLFLDSGYNKVDFDSANATVNGRFFSTSGALTGKLEFIPIMANASYSVKLCDSIHWYLGAGVGTVYDKFSAELPGNDGNVSSTKWQFGAQAFTGFSFDITPQAAFNIGYRYLYVHQSSEDFSGGNANTSSALAGFVFKF